MRSVAAKELATPTSAADPDPWRKKSSPADDRNDPIASASAAAVGGESTARVGGETDVADEVANISGGRSEPALTPTPAGVGSATFNRPGFTAPTKGLSGDRESERLPLSPGPRRRGTATTGCRPSRGERWPRPTRVEALDLEADLKHVRAASKVPVGDILVDVRQVRRGLKQVKDELEQVLAEHGKAEEEEEEDKGPREFSSSEAGAVATGLQSEVGFPNVPEIRVSAASEEPARSIVTPAPSMVEGGGAANYSPNNPAVVKRHDERKARVASVSSGGDEIRGAGAEAKTRRGRQLGVRKLERFAEDATGRLSSIEAEATECVARCKGLGEYFGEGADEAQSAHIFSTLVQFLDLLIEAKKVERVC